MKFGDNQSHLKAPVTEMNIPQDLISHEAKDSLNTLPDHRRTKMSDMKRLCNICTAVIDDDFLRMPGLFNRHIRIRRHGADLFLKKNTADIQVDKSRLYSLGHLESFVIFQNCSNFAGNHNRRLMITFRSGHGPVALIFAKIRAI